MSHYTWTFLLFCHKGTKAQSANLLIYSASCLRVFVAQKNVQFYDLCGTLFLQNFRRFTQLLVKIFSVLPDQGIF